MTTENKTVVDCMRSYVRVADMCDVYNKDHATNVSPWECVMLDGDTDFCGHPAFDLPVECYEFAVAIIEDKPVFFGGKIYSKSTFFPFDWDDPDYKTQINFKLSSGGSLWTWTLPTPKRTFTLNGVELPCPKKVNKLLPLSTRMEVDGNYFYFESDDDKHTVACTLTQLLTEARDKE